MARSVFIGLVFGLAIVSTPAAATRTFDFTARVDQANSLVPIDTVLTGSFSYDETIDPTSINTFEGYLGANYANPSISLTVNFGGSQYSTAAIAGVYNQVEDGSGFVVLGSTPSFNAAIYVWDPLVTFMAGIGLPTGFPALAQGPFPDPDDDDDMTVPHGEFSFYDGAANSGFDATILSVTPASAAAVPEPATWAMMIAGFGLIGGVMRRRRKLGFGQPTFTLAAAGAPA